MTQKLFLTSALAMGFVAPVFAEPSNTGTFPQDGYMQEDYTYTNAATSDNMAGVYENNATVNAVAEYIDDLYTIVAGQYLPAGAESPIDCDQSGYFCAGVQNGVYYDANNNQGLTSCSDATNGAYTLSAGTGDSVNSCYRECTNADIAHSTGTMNGGYYYGNNNQCEPTDCVNGWHVQPSVPDLTTVIGRDSRGVEHGYGNNGVSGTPSDYGITNTEWDIWAIDYGSAGAIKIRGICSAQQGINNWDGNVTTSSNVTEGGGYNCWCKIESYTPNMGTEQAISAPWVFAHDLQSSYYCSRCAQNCSRYIGANDDNNWQNFRIGFLGSVTPRSASCEANIININWSNADAEDISANNAGTATYDSDIRTPVKAQTIKGKTFKGWRFSKPQQTNLPE